MAYSGKFGSIMKQSLLQNKSLSNRQTASTSMFNAIRCMSTKLFIGGLSWGTSDEELRTAFASFGEVTEARVITDRDTGRSRGFGFVNYTSEDAANAAISSMDGHWTGGRNIRVSAANDRPQGGGGYRGGSGFGGGGGYGGGDSY